ncbi:23S rRNA (pseudouridine(1915)-N(3))-methyltransferase RlmH [Methanoplanus sp. FWC-SCC4]|uniref:Putative ribosomal RNA large subunit methyltransferase H n=1 Tax=Methanochimaera problematica TaxID=2609417 RepID=A0AA97I3W7_9EURY|nr:23S rRNA (pseudouridine(1915)-N(3))-methyltransferase RlmH [Methanoplanus sp. FWC-SCC4]WOF15691.1 23S rRNA (pseudouridine(1915)-N(3))-methyltransferase RlmH [Methanoplanus sp. FWC-SCC4]
MPLHIKVISVGKIKEKFFQDGISEFQKRLSSYTKLDFTEVPDEKIPNNASDSQITKIISIEGKKVLGHIKPDDIVIVMDLAGELWSSEILADKINNIEISGKSGIVFVIGGSLGISADLIKRADMRWCLSPLTFPHQFVKLILMEQLYRAFKINRGERYHR